MKLSIITGDNKAKSLNHHWFPGDENGFLDSGVVLEEESLNPDAVSGEEDEEEEEAIRFVSEC